MTLHRYKPLLLLLLCNLGSIVLFMANTILALCFLFLLLLLTCSSAARAEQQALDQNRNFGASRRKVLITTSDDAIDPPTTPIYNPTPGIITVPVALPPPAPIPPAIPNNTSSPVPITNPVSSPAVTNPVTTYPAVPLGPVTTTPPAAPASGGGGSWCVARTGAPQMSLQLGLDYACANGADCSQIQQGGSCYNPNTLQNHASFAFNSFYQKNPVATSCDFGGTAAVVTTNPSTGACMFSSSASPSSPLTAPATTSAPGAGATSSTIPPAVFNSSNPNSGTTSSGSAVPPNFDPAASVASVLQPVMGFIILVSVHCCSIYSDHVHVV